MGEHNNNNNNTFYLKQKVEVFKFKVTLTSNIMNINRKMSYSIFDRINIVKGKQMAVEYFKFVLTLTSSIMD